MRRILFLAGLVAPCIAGCMTPNCGSSWGFHAELLKAPTIKTENAVLLQQGAPVVAAHPMGNVSGPVTEGQNLFAPTQPPVVPAPPQLGRLKIYPGTACDPCQPRHGLTVEEWCKLMGEMQRSKMPVGN